MHPLLSLRSMASTALLVLFLLPQPAQSQQNPQISNAEMVFAQPNQTQLRLRLANAQYSEGAKHFREKQFTQAVDFFEVTLDVLQEDNVELASKSQLREQALYGLGISYWKTNRSEDALQTLDNLVAIENTPFAAEALYLRATILLENPTNANLEAAMIAMEESARSGSPKLQRISRQTAIAYGYNYSTLAYLRGEISLSQRLLERTFAVIGDAKLPPQQAQHLLFARGIYALSLGQGTSAATHLEALQQQSPNFKSTNGVQIKSALTNAYYQAGIEKINARQYDNALAFFNKAQSLQTEARVDILHGRFLVLARSERSSESQQVLNQIKTLDPKTFQQLRKIQRKLKR